MFTGELWDPGQAAITTMAHEAQSQAPGSEASTSSGTSSGTSGPSKADMQQAMFSEVKHSPGIRSSLRFTKAIGFISPCTAGRVTGTCQPSKTFAAVQSAPVSWLPRNRPFTRDEKAALNVRRCYADHLAPHP
ncbi:hypothetical protein HaLaN_23336 [Haematococcus lacustris]|uniref:Uncharacterized protein n=1 Tax=Haematococcus lacustris TaxID=44745 RepID=A0A6A0A176_HAELA|nr:hypothetical protein HaLaN_23336 [Haematococcus lacustris]